MRPGESRLYGLLGIVVWCFLSVALLALDSATTVAGVIVVPFVLVAPGTAVALVLRLHDLALSATVVIVTGMAVGVLVPSILLYADAWSPVAAFAIVAVATLATTGAGLILEGRSALRTR